jgi:hypothetical protein
MLDRTAFERNVASRQNCNLITNKPVINTSFHIVVLLSEMETDVIGATVKCIQQVQ